MKKIDLGQALTIVANLGVIVGIAFLAVELNQANRIARYSAEHARRDQFIELNSNAMEYSETVAKLQAGDAELTPSEQVQAMSMARMIMNSWFDAESAYAFGLLSEETYRIIEREPSLLMEELPGLAPFFAYLLDAYGHASPVAVELAEVLRSKDSD